MVSLGRLCRLMAAAGFIEEIAEDRYKPNNLTNFFGTKETFGAMHIQSWFVSDLLADRSLPVKLLIQAI